MASSASSPFLIRPLTAFAAGGFGGSSSSKTKTKGNKKQKQKPATPKAKPKAKAKAKDINININNNTSNLFSPEGRMAHMASQINTAQITLDPSNPNSICTIDNFIGTEFISSLRSEAESLLSSKSTSMVPSQSTRWDEATQSIIPYAKHQVMSMQIEGGAEGYAASPRLVEYVVTLTQSLSARLNTILASQGCGYQISEKEQTNKLAVCLGDGSRYDKHIDNGGGGDMRKLTALLYLQPSDWHDDNEDGDHNDNDDGNGNYKYPNESEKDDERGGYFRAYDVPTAGEVTSIAPKGDRLLLFWSDSLVHDVSPSYAPNGDDDRRWALTVWFVVDQVDAIRTTSAEVEDRHFGANG
jgi:Rps23 Pro-64 3,4-dihydroxylase Tpa1-like proline 4-hydroxylase